MLLTDGQPNVAPPVIRGAPAGENPHVSALLNYGKLHPGFEVTVRTFGFGYNLASDLLLDVAAAGGGTFAFVPVAPVMGTVFVHAIANTLSMYTAAATMNLAAVGGARFVAPGMQCPPES